MAIENGFIGYNATGYAELAAEINARKNNLLNILESFPEVEAAIGDAWKGEDADAYKEELANVIKNTKDSISNTYESMARQFNYTYNEWVQKQRANN